MVTKLRLISWACLLIWGVGMRGFELKSNSFKDNEFLNKKFTCEGENISPQLEWTNVPQGTISFALICEDPDAPRKEPWVHWIIFNIPANISNLNERLVDLKGSVQGVNDFGKIGYGGPCPPIGKAHRYFFTLYALDKELPLKSAVNKEELIRVMKQHVVGKAELIGLFQSS